MCEVIVIMTFFNCLRFIGKIMRRHRDSLYFPHIILYDSNHMIPTV